MYCKVNKRLAQFRPLGNTREHWEARWSAKTLSDVYAQYSAGHVDGFDDIFERRLPRGGLILEAGCGVGQLVCGLQARGYRVEGVDYAYDTVRRVNETMPSLKVRVDDIDHLNVADCTYDGYISIGVFEHNMEGPLSGLREMYRVLKPGGVGLVSVPLLNRRRKQVLKRSPEGMSECLDNGFRFYQYYYDVTEFKRYIETSGCSVVELYPYALYAGVTRDYTFGAWLHKHGFFIYRIQSLFSRWCQNAPERICAHYGHMMMFVCQK